MEQYWQSWELERIEELRRQRNVYGICWTASLVCLGLLVTVVWFREPLSTQLITLGATTVAGITTWLAHRGRATLAASALVTLALSASTLVVLISQSIGPSPYYASFSLLVAMTTLPARGVLAVAVAGAGCLFMMWRGTAGVPQPLISPSMLIVNASAVFVSTAAVSLLQARGHEQAVRQGVELARQRARIHEEHERLSEELERARRMEALGRLAGGVAHDFNNLLLVIQASADFARTTINDDDARKELEQIDDAAERGALLTRSLLTFARRQVVSVEQVDLVQVARELMPLLTTLVGPSVHIHFSADGPAPVRCSVGQIEQVLINLCANSRDAMPDGGRITLRICSFEREELDHADQPPIPKILVEVSDTGEGIPQEIAQRVFEPFFTTKPKGSGTGLGLSTSMGTIEQLGGQLTVESRPGKGCTMRIWLPRSEEDSEKAAPLEEARAAEPLHTIRTMLI